MAEDETQDNATPPEPTPESADGAAGGTPEGVSEEAAKPADEKPAVKNTPAQDDALAAAQAALAAMASGDAGIASQTAQSLVDEAAAEAAKEGPAGAGASAGGGGGGAKSFPLPSFDASALREDLPQGIQLLKDVNLNVKIELGRTRMLVEDVLKLSTGAVVELDKLAGDPVDVFVNERHVARGEVLVLNDSFCIRINEILDGSRATA